LKTRFSSPLSPNEISAIVRRLRKGEIGLFPTDTVYGLGCRADDVAATARVFRLKGRPLERTLPLLIGGWDQFDRLCENLRPAFRKRLLALWPGALTVVVEASSEALSLSYHCLNEGTVAVRMPDHPMLRYIIEQTGVPLAGTSANLSGGVEALTLGMVTSSIQQEVEWGWSENIPHNNAAPSAVVELTGSKPKILRSGSVTF